ncbi:alanine--tRNA ligase [Slackia equolifaciens]|uniref:Alanine--tRNA ligase n=1 Tax=Slackia equolifaciens TaxID=498718 RepID=A0A3N0B438_9ACTN|nr:alanine--tRNA ligase [Slackia equolifaciens]RNL41881.1 alanine--tRNA ligase [Slackia equolifaciens]
MKYMTTAEIREKYLKFFEEKGCKRMPSSSLIPDDPSLLLTSAGMVQFKPYFLHVKELDPAYVGTTTVQKCVRTNDIDIIGTTGRHLSFFEMLGNFSFGKYFKKEMCAWALEFSTQVLELPAERLYFTVFEDDDETIEIWKNLGVPEDHISRLGEDDNFWRAGPTGPCGPCSEIYFDQGPEVGCGKPDCKPGCDCDRFLEYWNCVFTQFDGQEDGTLAPLKTKNIDTGMGLERIAAIMQGVTNNYDTDVLRGLVAVGERLSGKAYESGDAAADLSLRIVADHSRSVTFMIADGILPSNEGRGYVLRRLLRRAVMHGHKLGIEGPFLSNYIDKIVEEMGSVYPEIVENRELVERVVASEEERFGATLRQGQAFLDEALAKLEGDTLSGKEAFTLHDTYGFPVEVTEEICAERGIKVDTAEFEACMTEQRERARAATKGSAEAAWSTYGGVHAELLKELGASAFVGYDRAMASSGVAALIKDGKRVDELACGDEGEVVLGITPFYAEMGGEVGDTGVMEGADEGSDLHIEVLDTKAPEKGLVCHQVKVVRGSVHVGDTVRAVIDERRRARISRNHTATHILHAALRQVLGDHVKQAGSYVGPDRLRFDFTHFEGVTPEQIKQVEDVANDVVMQATAMNIYETSLDEAREAGVTALFGEKYGDTVRVVEAGDFSAELCGGCHVSNTAEIGFIKIVSESSVGANLRRIEAVTSFDALAYMNREEDELKRAAATLKVTPLEVADRCAANAATIKEFEAERKRARQAEAEGSMADYLKDMIDVGYPLVVARIDGLDTGALRNAWDIIRGHMDKPGACVLGTVNNDKPVIMAAGTDEAVAAGFNAGAVIKAIAGNIKGGGGGKPTMAQAGGKDASGMDAALAAAKEMLGA